LHHRRACHRLRDRLSLRRTPGVFMVRRTRAKGASLSKETICGITSLPIEEANEHRLLELNLTSAP